MWPAGRILIVDDEAHVRDALSELLHDEGYEVATAVDGFAARARIAEFCPDVVLTDLQMPGMEGLRLGDERCPGGQAPTLVLMSARPEPDVAGVPFVGKPIDIEQLIATVETTLARRRQAARNSSPTP